MIAAKCDICGKAATGTYKVVRLTVGSRPILVGPEVPRGLTDLCDEHSCPFEELWQREVKEARASAD